MTPMMISQFSGTMTSREVAELVGMRHDNVLRTARRLLEQGVTQSEETQIIHEQNGQSYPIHQLNFRDSMILVAQCSPQFTARVIDRWQELEQTQAEQPQIEQLNRQVEVLTRTLSEHSREIERLQHGNNSTPALRHSPAPAVYRTDLKTTTEVAKSLGITAIALNQFLREAGVKMKGQDLPLVNYMDWFQTYCGTSTRNGHDFKQCMIKPEGVKGITELWNSAREEVAA